MNSLSRSNLGRRYMTSVAASATGRNAYFVIVAWMAADVSGGPAFVALLLTASSIAEFLTANLGGKIVDRYERRLVCLACDLARIILMTVTILGLAVSGPLAVLAVSWVAYAVVDRTYLTALQAMIPSLEPPNRLMHVNSMAYLIMQVGNFAGALAAGALLVSIPGHFTLALPLSCYLLSLFMLSARGFSLLSQPPARRIQETRLFDRTTLPLSLPPSQLRLLAVVYAVIYAMGMLVSVLASALVLRELKGSALDFGYVEAFWAAGSVLGCFCLLLSPPRRHGLVALVVVSGAVLAVFLIVQASYIVFLQMIVLGVTYNVARVMMDVQVQRLVPSEVLGRCRGQIHTLCVAFGLVVYASVAFAGNALSPSMMFGLYGLLMVVAASFLVGFQRRVPAGHGANP